MSPSIMLHGLIDAPADLQATRIHLATVERPRSPCQDFLADSRFLKHAIYSSTSPSIGTAQLNVREARMRCLQKKHTCCRQPTAAESKKTAPLARSRGDVHRNEQFELPFIAALPLARPPRSGKSSKTHLAPGRTIPSAEHVDVDTRQPANLACSHCNTSRLRPLQTWQNHRKCWRPNGLVRSAAFPSNGPWRRGSSTAPHKRSSPRSISCNARGRGGG